MGLLQRLRGRGIKFHDRPAGYGRCRSFQQSMDTVFRGADGRIFLGISSKNHVDGPLCMGTFAPCLFPLGGSASLIPLPSVCSFSRVIVPLVEEPGKLSFIGQLIQDTLEFATLGEGMAVLFVVVTPQIVIAPVGRSGSGRWSWQLVANGKENIPSVSIKHRVVSSV